MPVALEYESGVSFSAKIVDQVRGKSVVIYMGKTTERVLHLEDSLAAMKIAAKEFIWLSDIEANPSYRRIAKHLNALGDREIEVVCAIGGGSAIDTAKACVAMDYLRAKESVNEESVKEAIMTEAYLANPSQITLLVAPTTAGTGSEVTKWATIWHPEGLEKYSVDAPWLYPEKAYLVAEFTATMPAMLTLSTGLDALSHACEAYWAKASNPMAKALAKSAVREIVAYLPRVLAEPAHALWREKMLTAATLSGMAFAQTRTTACHAISYPLTGLYHLPHGLACVITLPGVMAINMAADASIGELLTAMGFADTHALREWIKAIAHPIVVLELQGFGVRKEDLESLTAQCFATGRMSNNPVDLTKAQVYEILLEVL